MESKPVEGVVWLRMNDGFRGRWCEADRGKSSQIFIVCNRAAEALVHKPPCISGDLLSFKATMTSSESLMHHV